MANLWTDPSFEGATSPDNVGTPTTSAQDAGQAHSGSNSWKVIADAADEGISRTMTVVSGTFYQIMGWVYADTSGTVDMEITGGAFQNGTTTKRTTSTTDAWQNLGAIVRATSTSLVVKFTSNAAQTFYVDDVGVLGDDAVSLTATPASEANSAESGGLRVDGGDTLTQPAANLTANSGKLRFSVTMRSDPADWGSWGNSEQYFVDMYEDANNYVRAYISAANTITIAYNAQGAGEVTDTYDATGETWAATKKQIEVQYGASGAKLTIGGTIGATAAGAVILAALPTNAVNWGHRQDGTRQLDGVIGPY